MNTFDIHLIPSQENKIAIVTGANTGLGFETTLALAKKDMTVIMACRNADKAQIAKDQIIREVPNARIELLTLDLSSLKSVRNFASNFLNKFKQLHLLINNAGIMIPPYSKTEDGFESQFATNYLGHFLLTGLLLDTIIKTPDSRIVSLSSIAHKKGKIVFDDLNWEKKYSAMGAYGQSKLACLMFAYELQRRFDKAGITTKSVAAHPGVSDTELFRHIPKFAYYIGFPIIKLMTQSAKNGAMPTLYAALNADVSGGDYIGPKGFLEMKGKPHKTISTPLSHDTDIAEKLWGITEKLTGITYKF
jgi:NAD(P)-dependent dehydrogenase (short-subunit alcohol dehydrogenase family)